MSVSAGVLIILLLGACHALAADAPAANLGYRTPAQDLADMRATCKAVGPGGNLVLVLTVRGSGELARHGALSTKYYPALASALVAKGYRVSAIEIAYPALGTEQLIGHVPEYLKSAVGSADDVAAQLAAYIGRCPTRQVVIAAYSQGGIALRAAIDRLSDSPRVWRLITQIDLFGDGSASTGADRLMPTGPTPLTKAPARRGTQGVWLFGYNATRDLRSPLARLYAAILRADNLKAIASIKSPTAYPRALQPRIDRYCMSEDIVCDTRHAIIGFVSRAEDIGCTIGAVGAAACSTSSGWFTAYRKYVVAQHGLYRWKLSALDTAAGFDKRDGGGGSGSPDPGGNAPSVPPRAVYNQRISTGVGHSCVLTLGGVVKCWGWNGSSQLGDGRTTDSLTPVTAAVSGVTQIVAGVVHSCALIQDGTVACWGNNSWGQTGDTPRGTTTYAPSKVAGVLGATQISASAGDFTWVTYGAAHSCARIQDGAVQCWGMNRSGELGDGTTTDSSVPVTVAGLSGATHVTAGTGYSCALIQDASIKCWGWNANGELGDGTTVDSPAPVSVAGLSHVTQVSASDHSCALIDNGTVECWGPNASGQLGDGTTNNSSLPVKVVGLSRVVQVTTADQFSCALLQDGTVRCWGANYWGYLGDGTRTNSSTPVSVSGLSGVIDISSGYEHSCALIQDGSVRCWGLNTYGQLGDGTTTFKATPVPVAGLS